MTLYLCLCTLGVTVTPLHPLRLCRIAVFSLKPTFLSLTQCLNPELLWAYTFMADMCFEYADYGSDGTRDWTGD